MRFSSVAFFISILSFQPQAHAWGQLIELNGPKARAHLIYTAVEKNSIAFCLTIDPAKAVEFDSASMELQVRAALRAWLVPLRQRGLPPVHLSRVDCGNPSFDVKVDISQDFDFPKLGSYQMEKTEGAHLFTYIKIDPYFRYEGFGFVDTRTLLAHNDLRTLAFYLETWVNSPLTTPATSVYSFAAMTGHSYPEAFWTTYRDLLHEMGHAFGLCDTIPSQVTAHCDPNHFTTVFKNTVMSDSNYLSLTEDDVEGIVGLMDRVR